MLGIEPGSSRRAASSRNCWVSLQPLEEFFLPCIFKGPCRSVESMCMCVSAFSRRFLLLLLVCLFLFFVFPLFEAGSLLCSSGCPNYADQAWNSKRSTCLCLLSTGIKNMYYYAWPSKIFLFFFLKQKEWLITMSPDPRLSVEPNWVLLWCESQDSGTECLCLVVGSP